MIFNNIKTNKTLFSEQQKKNIQNNNLNLIIKKINNYKDKYKNISIYIPKYNEEFWHIIKKNNKSYWCSSTSFLIPALSGVSKIKGLQDPNLCETYYIAGPSEYSSDAYLSNLNDSEICLYARKRSIEYIYKFNSIDNEKDNILLSCKIS